MEIAAEVAALDLDVDVHFTGAFLAVDIDSHPADIDTLRERGWAGYAQHVA